MKRLAADWLGLCYRKSVCVGGGGQMSGHMLMSVASVWPGSGDPEVRLCSSCSCSWSRNPPPRMRSHCDAALMAASARRKRGFLGRSHRCVPQRRESRNWHSRFSSNSPSPLPSLWRFQLPSTAGGHCCHANTPWWKQRDAGSNALKQSA